MIILKCYWKNAFGVIPIELINTLDWSHRGKMFTIVISKIPNYYLYNDVYEHLIALDFALTLYGLEWKWLYRFLENKSVS